MKLRLSQSRLRSARSCQRLHHFAWHLGYKPVQEAEALRFGTLVHKALEAWWKAPEGGRLAAALAALAGHEADPFERAKAEALMVGYDARWIGAPYEVLGVETEFLCDLRNPDTGRCSQVWELGGTLDGIVRDLRDGRVLVLEHKTASGDISPGSDYWKRLRMDVQVSVYYDGAEALGHKPDGCLYDVIGKPALRPLKATPPEARKFTKDGRLYANQRETDETPAEYRARVAEDIAANPADYFQRGEVVRLEHEMHEARRDVWQLAHQLREAERAESWPRNPDACVLFGRTCPFFSVCAGEASLEDSTLFVRNPNTAPREVAQ